MTRSGRASGSGEGMSAASAHDTQDPEARARQICLRLLTAAPRTRAELAQAMNRDGVPDEAAEAILIRFTDVGLIDLGVEQGIVRKSGAWYTYGGDQLGQGKENARSFLRDNPDLANEIEKRIKEKLGVGPRLDTDADVNASSGNASSGNVSNGSAGNGSAGPGGSASGRPTGNGASSSRPTLTVPGIAD